MAETEPETRTETREAGAEAETETAKEQVAVAEEAPAAERKSESVPAQPSASRVRPSGGPLDAYEALARSSRLEDVLAVAKKILGSVRAGHHGAGFGPPVRAAAEDVNLAREDAETPYGNALEVLESGPKEAAERALACAIAAHFVAESPRADHDRVAADVLWLAAHTAFDATSLVDRALGEDADDLWAAIADLVRRGGLSRAEQLLGCAALASSEGAKRRREELAGALKDPVLVRMLTEGAAPALANVRLEGEMTPAPRGAVLTTVLACTGLLAVVAGARLLARFALAYRAPAEVTLTADGVRVKTRTEMLGKVLREREHAIPRAGLVRVEREVRYPSAAFYAGLLALAVGSYVGVRAFVDGVRAASPSLLVVGLVVIALGVAADFVLGSVLPGARGRCRVLFVPRAGKTICIGEVDSQRADDALRRGF